MFEFDYKAPELDAGAQLVAFTRGFLEPVIPEGTKFLVEEPRMVGEDYGVISLWCSDQDSEVIGNNVPRYMETVTLSICAEAPPADGWDGRARWMIQQIRRALLTDPDWTRHFSTPPDVVTDFGWHKKASRYHHFGVLSLTCTFGRTFDYEEREGSRPVLQQLSWGVDLNHPADPAEEPLRDLPAEEREAPPGGWIAPRADGVTEAVFTQDGPPETV